MSTANLFIAEFDAASEPFLDLYHGVRLSDTERKRDTIARFLFPSQALAEEWGTDLFPVPFIVGVFPDGKVLVEWNISMYNLK